MDLNHRLQAAIRCIKSNGGGQGGVRAIDAAAEHALTTPATLTRRERLILLPVQLGYFYANQSAIFNEFREDLWRCLAANLPDLPSDVPSEDEFNLTTDLVQITA